MAPNVVTGCTLVPLNMLPLVLSRMTHRKLEPKDGLGALPRIGIDSADAQPEPQP
jgi:hypothetical protein